MPSFLDFFRQLARPTIRTRRDLAGYVAGTTLVCVLLASGVDVVNQLVFFVDWETTLRSWLITVILTAAIATTASWAIGRVHLELYHAKRAVDILSRTDPLTGLPNRRAVFEVAERSASSTMVLVLFDIDRFKRVNDTRGHLAGDEVIRMVGRMMAAELGSLGYVGRIGGEEFALVGTNVAIDRLIASLGAFRARVASTPIVVPEGAVVVTVSAGAAIRAPSQSFNDLYAEADQALYAAKALGRNRVSYSPTLQAQIGDDTARDEAMWQADTESNRRRLTSDDDIASVA